jgi:hypothetical protein
MDEQSQKHSNTKSGTRGRSAAIPAAVATLAAACLLVAGTACSDTSAPASQAATYLGASAAIETGSGHTYVTLNPDGSPDAIGIRISASALPALPAGAAMYTFALPTDAAAHVTPYDHVMINWNPTGHPPAAYMVPHFDIHFYQVTMAEQAAIAPSDPQFAAKLALDPPAAFIPVNYQHNPPGGVPNMGAHWIDTTAPELNGQPFTATFIYGSYNGQFMFAEPMIARSYLESHATTTTQIGLPAQYPAPGYYPTSYTVSYDTATQEHVVSLGGFVHRD